MDYNYMHFVIKLRNAVTCNLLLPNTDLQHLSLFTSHAVFISYFYFISSFSHKKSSLPRNHQRASHFSPGKILMSLQGPSRSNYVEQLLSVTGPQLPGENTNLPGKAKLAYFWQNTRHMRIQITPGILHYHHNAAAAEINIAVQLQHPKFNLKNARLWY